MVKIAQKRGVKDQKLAIYKFFNGGVKQIAQKKG